MKRLFLFATLPEAEATIISLKADETFSEGSLRLYECDKGLVAVSGIGIHAAQLAACKWAHCVDEIWNLGLAGCLHSHFPLGSLHSISKVGKYIPAKENLDPISLQIATTYAPTFPIQKEGLQLISSDFPIHNDHHRTQLNSNWDLVDMEGYGVAYAAHHLRKPCFFLKIVSDFTSSDGRTLIRTHMKTFSTQLAEALIKKLYSGLNFK